MPRYKLTYFSVTGAGEHIRYIFAYAGQQYEDNRVTFEEWPTLKPDTPYGKLPILEVDGRVFNQSNSIARYLAKQFGLDGSNDLESLQADALVDTLTDFKQIVMKLYWDRTLSEEKKTELRKEAIENHIPYFLSRFEKVAASNSSGYLVGSQVTWADLTFAHNLEDLNSKFPGSVQPYPALTALIEKINNLPNIKKWRQNRPADIIPAQFRK